MNEVFRTPRASAAAPPPSPGLQTRELPTSVPAPAPPHRRAHAPGIQVGAIVPTAPLDPTGPARQNQSRTDALPPCEPQLDTSCRTHCHHSHDSARILNPLRLPARIDRGPLPRFFLRGEEISRAA